MFNSKMYERGRVLINHVGVMSCMFARDVSSEILGVLSFASEWFCIVSCHPVGDLI